MPHDDNQATGRELATRDPLALAMFAAWMNVRPDQVPPEYLGHTNPHTMEAWKRVGEAAIAFTRTPSSQREAPTGEVERLREALRDILHCTPANTNFYDCGDPFEIARAFLSRNPDASPVSDGEAGDAQARCDCGKPATTKYEGDDMCEKCATYCARRDFEESEMPGGFK